MPSIKIYGKKDKSTHVRIKIAQSEKELTSLLLDSGCAISIIKFSVLKPDVNIFPDQKVELVGITGSIISKGAAFLLLKVGRKQVIHEFQVINDTDANTAGFDGILGQNIIKNCIIDFVKMTMSYLDFHEREIHEKNTLKDALTIERKSAKFSKAVDIKEKSKRLEKLLDCAKPVKSAKEVPKNQKEMLEILK